MLALASDGRSNPIEAQAKSNTATHEAPGHMSMHVVLQQEDGTKLPQRMGDAGHTLMRLLVVRTQESGELFHYLPYIDPYGDTIFNCLQAEPVLAELARLRKFALSSEEHGLLDGVEAIVTACKDSNHLYVRFVGD